MKMHDLASGGREPPVVEELPDAAEPKAMLAAPAAVAFKKSRRVAFVLEGMARPRKRSADQWRSSYPPRGKMQCAVLKRRGERERG
jgi:hypothetical protein